MRVVGYVRDSPDPSEAEPAFAQQERVRRWINDSGHQLVAICQDVRTPGRPLGRDGYRAMIGIIGTGEAQAVLVPFLEALSPDKVSQEIMLWDLRSRGIAVLSASEEDLPQLEDPPQDSARILVRDVLAKVGTHIEMVGTAALPITAPAARPELPTIERIEPDYDDDEDVVVELIAPVASEKFEAGRITPAL
ncbi:MAG: recombinase family protein [Acidimicrobiia bacterium]|nr:recombinase family protein [Acidimicrobiia bacterium]